MGLARRAVGHCGDRRGIRSHAAGEGPHGDQAGGRDHRAHRACRRQVKEEQMESNTYQMETNASSEQLRSRDALKDAYQNSPLPIDHLMTNFGLYMRGSVLVKILVVADLYQRILHLPGVIME